MKQYDVYGLGNALVDINFEVNESSLNELNINKGVMTLIDADRELALLEALDGIKHHRACGGSAANTLITVAQLGGQGFYSCKVAADEAGNFFLADLKKSGLDTNLSYQPRMPGTTGKCIVMVTPDTDRTMNTYLGITAAFSKHELDHAAIAASEYIYIEGYLIASPTAYEAMQAAIATASEHNTKISMTLSDLNMVVGFKYEFLSLLSKPIDLLFCNETEALHFCDTQNITEAQTRLKNFARQHVITLGGKGVLVYDGHEHFHVPAYPITAVDTVGAGDTFAGAFLHAVTHHHSFQTAAEIANFAASKVVSKFGPRLDQQESQQVLNKLAAFELEFA